MLMMLSSVPGTSSLLSDDPVRAKHKEKDSQARDGPGNPLGCLTSSPETRSNLCTQTLALPLSSKLVNLSVPQFLYVEMGI